MKARPSAACLAHLRASASEGKASFGIDLNRRRRVSWQRSNTRPRGLSNSKHLRICGGRFVAFSRMLNALRSVSMSAMLWSEPKPTLMTFSSLIAKTIADIPRPMHFKSNISPAHLSGTGFGLGLCLVWAITTRRA
jgi:hypothetical protein